MRLAGIDLAWKAQRNATAVAIAELNGAELRVESVEVGVFGIEGILERLKGCNDLQGLAIDASLIINNSHGQRECERALSRHYGSRKVACHASNQTLYPDADSVALSEALTKAGFEHLGKPRFQLECYPHPALIELFELKERLLYKKGAVAERREGQKELARRIDSLKHRKSLSLQLDSAHDHLVDINRIHGLRGQALKANEDCLDALICLYVAGLYARGSKGFTFGNTRDGYIWVPNPTDTTTTM